MATDRKGNTSKTKTPVLPTIHVRERFDAQVTFQMYSREKQAILSQIDNRRFRVMGDVLREMMLEYFEHHDIDPEAFRSATLVVEKKKE